MDLEATNMSNLLTSLNESEAASSSESGASAPPAEASPDPSAPVETASADPQATELERLRRVIAGSPQLRQQYEAELYRDYGAEAPRRPEPSAPPPQAPALPFEPDLYDPTSLEHQMALIGHVVSQALEPAYAFIQQQTAEIQAAEQQQQLQLVGQSERLLQETLDKLVPGSKSLFESQTLSDEQSALKNYAETLFVQTMQQYPEGLWFNPRVLQEVANQIAPKVQKLGSSLGLFQPPAPGAPSVKDQELYVEGSNAVPSETANAFEKAAQAGSLAGMLKHL